MGVPSKLQNLRAGTCAFSTPVSSLPTATPPVPYPEKKGQIFGIALNNSFTLFKNGRSQQGNMTVSWHLRWNSQIPWIPASASEKPTNGASYSLDPKQGLGFPKSLDPKQGLGFPESLDPKQGLGFRVLGFRCRDQLVSSWGTVA